MMEVALGPDEVAIAELVGSRRHRSCKHAGVASRFPGDDAEMERQHQRAAGAEIAVARVLGCYVEAWEGRGKENAKGDVAGRQVRHTVRANGGLVLRDRASGRAGVDDPDQRFILVTGELPVLVVRGWLLAREGMRSEYWRDDMAIFLVPQARLRPMPATVAERWLRACSLATA